MPVWAIVWLSVTTFIALGSLGLNIMIMAAISPEDISVIWDRIGDLEHRVDSKGPW